MPPKTDEKAFLLRVSKDDYEALKICAEAIGLSVSGWCRMALKAEAAKALRNLKKGQMK